MAPKVTTVNANNAPTQYVAVGKIRFAYRDLGPRDGIPVVFLHHFTAVLDDWDPRVIDGLSATRRVITFDNRGVGGTGGHVPTSISAMAEDAVAFITALGLEQVDLIGFSMGGFISQVIAERHRDLVRRVVLAGTGPAGGEGVGKVTPKLVGDLLHGLVTRTDPKRYLFFTRTPHGKASASAFMDRIKERTQDRVRTTSPLGVAAQVAALNRWGRQDPMDLGAIKHPVLVVNGEDDRMVPTKASFDLAHRLPNASLRIYPDAGHGGLFQCHDQFVAQVSKFLR